MNDVIRKCVEELNKADPNIDYVRGMLDTLLSMSTTGTPVPTPINATTYLPYVVPTSGDPEIEALEAQTRAALKKMPPTEMI